MKCKNISLEIIVLQIYKKGYFKISKIIELSLIEGIFELDRFCSVSGLIILMVKAI